MDRKRYLRRRIRLFVVAIMIGIVLSGATAFPLRWEMDNLAKFMGASPTDTVETTRGLLQWVVRVRDGLSDAFARYPFIAYGTDWLAFAHLVIATAFIGLLRDPVRNIWIVEWAMIACIGVIPLALICGPIREIPFYHQLIDCSFGVVCIVPLWFLRGDIKELGSIEKKAV